jgi:hypothetical protein
VQGYAAFFMASTPGIVSLVKKGGEEKPASLSSIFERSLKTGFILFTDPKKE